MTRLSRRTFLAASGAAALSGCLGIGGGNDRKTPTGPVTSAPVPDNPGQYTYATMGSGTTGTTVTYFGNWKCPYCKQFSEGFLNDVVSNYVEPGKLDLEFRALAYSAPGKPFLGPDAPRAAQAGLAVWHAEPESFWNYYEYVFTNQQSEKQEWATTSTLVDYANSAGVKNTDAIKRAIQNDTYQKELQQTTNAAAKHSVKGIPTLLIDGKTISPFNESKTKTLLDNASNG